MLKVAIVGVIGVFLLAGCKSDEIKEDSFSSGSKISSEHLAQAQSLDKASYQGLEHIFGDTANISSDGKPVILIFGKNGCQWCDKLKDEIKQNLQTQEMLIQNFKSYYINLSYSKIHNLNYNGKLGKIETIELARQYQIRPTPTSVFLDSDGKPIFSYPGYFTQPQMQAILNFISSKEYKKAKTQEEFFKMLGEKLKETK